VPLVLPAIPAALLLANLTAAGPGWAAAHTGLALILRGEWQPPAAPQELHRWQHEAGSTGDQPGVRRPTAQVSAR